jgi:hypothetical protein
MLVSYEDARFSAMLGTAPRSGFCESALCGRPTSPRFFGRMPANGPPGKRPLYVQYALSVNSSDGIVTITILASRASDHRYA